MLGGADDTDERGDCSTVGRGLSPLQHTILALARENLLDAPEPTPVAYRVTVRRTTWEWHGSRLRRNPIDLRRLVPEAFTNAQPDGYWTSDSVIAGSFADYDQAQAFAATLASRGIDELPPYRDQRGLASHLYREVIRRERDDEHAAAYSALTLGLLTGHGQQRPDPRHAPGTVIPDLYGWEILAAAYRFPFRQASIPRPPSDFPRARFARSYWDWLGRKRGGRFDKASLAPSRYNTAFVDAHRATDRLVARELAVRVANGINLTSTGMSVAAGTALSAKFSTQGDNLADRAA